MEAREVIRRKKRRRMVQRFIDTHAEVILGAFAAVAVLCAAALITAAHGLGKEQNAVAITTQPEPAQVETQKQEQYLPQYRDPLNYEYPFNTMSADWGAEDVEGFTLYEIPEEYRRTGGALPEVVQVYTYCLCRENGVDFATVLAMIEVESGYKWNAESGVAYGYLQIVPEYHAERMERLHVGDILNPYGNIRTGIDYMKELLDKYGGSYGKALTAYHYGPTGAQREFFSKGAENSSYSERVAEIAERIEPGREEE